MSDSELVAQRRANFEELTSLGVHPYPYAYEATHRIADLVAAYGETSGDVLEAEPVLVRAAGRILGLRTFGKANFLVLSDGAATIQAYVREDSVSAEVFALFKIAVVVQQIYHRFVKGQTNDPRFATLGDRVTYLAGRAAALL